MPRSPQPADESPPSAEDFWGERSAAIQNALQAPADDPAAVVAAGTRRPRAQPPRARSTDARRRRQSGRRRRRAWSRSSSSFSGPSRPAGGAKDGVAAVFGSGVSRIDAARSRPRSTSARRRIRDWKPGPERTRHTPIVEVGPRTRPSRQRPIAAGPQLRSAPSVSETTPAYTLPLPTTPTPQTPGARTRIPKLLRRSDRSPAQPAKPAGCSRAPSARRANPARSAQSRLRTDKEHR